MKPNFSAWLEAVSNNHPSFPELLTELWDLCLDALSLQFLQTGLAHLLAEEGHPPWHPPCPWAKRCKEAECTLVEKAEDFGSQGKNYRVKRQLREKHLYQPLHAVPVTHTARPSRN